MSKICDVPPAGWFCTRAPGHDGPCAAIPLPGGANICRNPDCEGCTGCKQAPISMQEHEALLHQLKLLQEFRHEVLAGGTLPMLRDAADCIKKYSAGSPATRLATRHIPEIFVQLDAAHRRYLERGGQD